MSFRKEVSMNSDEAQLDLFEFCPDATALRKQSYLLEDESDSSCPKSETAKEKSLFSEKVEDGESIYSKLRDNKLLTEMQQNFLLRAILQDISDQCLEVANPSEDPEQKQGGFWSCKNDIDLKAERIRTVALFAIRKNF